MSGTYHDGVIQDLIGAFRVGRPVDALWFLFASVLASAIWIASYDVAVTPSVLLVALGIAVASFLVGWWITGRMALDAARVHAENEMLRERAHRRGEAFRARPIAVECSDDEFASIVEEELAALPPWLQKAIHDTNVAIAVEDERADEPRTLGLYQEQACGEDRVSTITLYRESILRTVSGPDGLHRQIHDTLLHELGHLFGMSEADLNRYTIGNDPLPGADPVHPPRR